VHPHVLVLYYCTVPYSHMQASHTDLEGAASPFTSARIPSLSSNRTRFSVLSSERKTRRDRASPSSVPSIQGKPQRMSTVTSVGCLPRQFPTVRISCVLVIKCKRGMLHSPAGLVPKQISKFQDSKAASLSNYSYNRQGAPVLHIVVRCTPSMRFIRPAHFEYCPTTPQLTRISRSHPHPEKTATMPYVNPLHLLVLFRLHTYESVPLCATK
jgi:hypothetical protein